MALKRRSKIAIGTVFAILVSIPLLLVACATTNPNYQSDKPHHTPKGFTNLNGPNVEKPLSSLLRWQREAWSNGLPKPPSQVVNGYNFPLVKPDFNLLNSKHSKVTVTWIGHATALVQMGGLNILTDPIFSERASPVQFSGPKRKTSTPISLAELPYIDLVVISHNHYDHLDRQTVLALKDQKGGSPLFAAPLGVHQWFLDQGISNVQKFDWWQTESQLPQLKGLAVTFVPSQHWSARTPFDRHATLWGSWVFQADGFTTFFSGDTGYSKDFKDIAQRFGKFDLALIPVGAYEPRWFMQDQHVNPAEAVAIHQDLSAALSIGIHWGTFELTDESLDQPMIDLPKALDAAGVGRDKFVMLKHGETRVVLGR